MNIEQAVTEAVLVSKLEILTDINEGRVPATVADFSELHDYVDANEYGGLCADGARAVYGFPEQDNAADDDDAWQDFGNRVQNRVNEWLKAGRV